MKKKKILHVIATLNHGGAENVAVNFFRLVNKEKYTCDYLIYVNDKRDYEDEIKKLGGNVYCITNPHTNYCKWKKEFKEILKTKGPYDIVHSHNLFHSGDVLKLSKRMGVKMRIAHSHTTSSSLSLPIIKKIYDSIKRNEIKRYATDIVACGKEAGDYLFGRKLFQEKGIIINNDIDLNKFGFNNDIRKKIRKELNIENNFVLLNVGRLLPVKNQIFLIELMRYIKCKNNHIKLIIIGDGPMKDELDNKIKEYSLEDNIVLLGNRSDVNRILNAADMFIMPSLFEGLPLAIIEAQGNGLHVLASNTISRECDITGLVNFFSLDDSIETWTNAVLNGINYKHEDTKEIIINKHYDTESNKIFINDFYDGGLEIENQKI